ncbi:hemolysin-III related-domain-containing protein [Lophiotrema nucula]|uniref:Hemolysin-III related-domain-containing protein n=1 Tax=Lophiotrema nucula TaxID=690887 RepID=A0A6A5Z047_9PLEO|nr:hemolysin-III related-domain-containing protein [Lophiotrema nucula]
MGKGTAKTVAHERKPSKPQNEQYQLAEHIKQALHITQSGQLLTIEQLPRPWRINPFIVRGYTFAPSIADCIRTVVRLSNESFNIWSHIFGVCFVLYLAFWHYPLTPVHAQANNTDNFIMGIYFAAATLCLSCSVFWHTMKCHHDPHFMISCASVDLMGVTVMISAMNVVTQYAAFYCSHTTQTTWLSLTALCGTTSLLLGWSPTFRHPDLAWVRVVVFTLLGIVGLLPIGHLAFTEGWGRAWTFYKPVWVEVVAPIFSGAWIYAGKVPERWWPGVFDFAGHSHNVWHVAVLATVWGGYKVALQLMENALGSC